MANIKISDLPAAASGSDTQEFEVNDSGTSKKVTGAQLKAYAQAGLVDTTGDTMTGNLNFGDSVKANFGASNDLQIYHDGSNSYIYESGAGNLYMQGANYVYIGNPAGEVCASFASNGAAALRYDNSTKLETTSYGMLVAGSAVATTSTTSVSGSVTLDFNANQNFVLTMTGNVTLANPTTEKVGQSGFIVLKQDATGGRTVSLGTDYETAGGAGLTLSSAANATDVVPYIVAASGRILLGTPQLAFA